jgi:hypothetical protein
VTRVERPKGVLDLVLSVIQRKPRRPGSRSAGRALEAARPRRRIASPSSRDDGRPRAGGGSLSRTYGVSDPECGWAGEERASASLPGLRFACSGGTGGEPGRAGTGGTGGESLGTGAASTVVETEETEGLEPAGANSSDVLQAEAPGSETPAWPSDRSSRRARRQPGQVMSRSRRPRRPPPRVSPLRQAQEGPFDKLRANGERLSRVNRSDPGQPIPRLQPPTLGVTWRPRRPRPSQQRRAHRRLR